MGLLSKALLYREQLLKSAPKGLLYKALRYLESKKSQFPEIIESTDVISLELDNNEEIINLKDYDFSVDLKDDTDLSEEINLEQNISIPEEMNEETIDVSEFDITEETPHSIDILDEQSGVDEDIASFDVADDTIEEVITPLANELNNEIDADEKIISVGIVDEDVPKTESLTDLPDVQENEEIISINNEIDDKDKSTISDLEVFDELENGDDETNSFDNPEIKPAHASIYFDIINNISKEMSTLIVDDKAYKKFSEILSNNFNFTKSALMIYFPPKQKFILWNGKNLDDESSAKLYFDLEFNNIYKNLSKEKSFFIKKDDDIFNDFSSLFSEYDLNDSNFILWIPFIFSARIIGIYLGLKLNDRKTPVPDMISSLEIIGRLNGPLLYNLYQQETIRQQQQKITKTVEKKNPAEEKVEINSLDTAIDETLLSNDIMDDYDKNQTDNIIVQMNGMEEIDNPVSLITSVDTFEMENSSGKIEIPETDLKEVDLFDIFPENIHKLIYFAEQTISNSPESPLTLIHILFENNDEIQNFIPNFRFETFYSDIQFVIMNVVGTNGFVQILRDMNIYIVLPEIKKSMAQDLLNEITDQLKKMFVEIHENVNVRFKNTIVNYPVDAKDHLDLFYKIQKL